MKLIGFNVQDFKRISIVELELKDQGLTVIKGNNQQGKSSLIQALEFLLLGKNALSNDNIVRVGADNAKISGTFATSDGEKFTVSRVLSPDGTASLKIVQDDLVKKRPQEFLNTLINELSFDPKPFVNKKDREKVLFLLKLLKIDTNVIDKNIKATYDKRRFMSQELHRIGQPSIPSDLAIQFL